MNTIVNHRPLAVYVNRLMKNSRFQFWSLQLIGWGGYGFFIMLEAWVHDEINIFSVSFTTIATLLGLLLTLGLRRSFHLFWNAPPVKRSLLTLLTVAVATGMWSTWKLHVSYAMSDKEIEHLLYETVYWFSYSFFILLSWTGLYYCIKYYKLVQEEHEKTQRADAMAHQAQLKMLRYQLNPHFLFNTLNSVSTLIMERENDTANRMISGLSRFLRYSLDNDPMQKISLDSELHAMQLYLDIEKIRFGDRLHLQYDIDQASRQALIPSMLLQPLIENSIKYAIAISETGGTIRIASGVSGSELHLEVSDDGPGIHPDLRRTPGTNGVGMDNIRERLKVLYGENQSFTLSNDQPRGLRIRICIPYVTENNSARRPS